MKTHRAPWDYERQRLPDRDYDVSVCAKCGRLVIFDVNGSSICSKCGTGCGFWRVPQMLVREFAVSMFVRHPEIFDSVQSA